MKEPIRKVTLASGKVRWRVIVDVGRKADGTRDQRCSTHDTQKAARAWLSDVRSEVGKGTFVKPSKETLGEHLDGWLAGRALDGGLKPATLRCYRDALVPVRALLAGRALQDVTPDDLDRVRRGMLDGSLRSTGTKGKPLSPRSVNLMLTVVSMALDQAVKRGKVQRNVAALVDRVKGSQDATGQAWTPEQAATFLATVASERLHAAWLATMYGMRRGEVLGLRWSDVDLAAGTLSIRQARVLVAGEVHVGTPKTHNGVRDLPLPGDLSVALRALQQAQREERMAAGPAWTDSGLVVVDALGQPIHPEHYSDEWARLVRKAGLPMIRLHDARHTSVTTMRAAGMPDHLVARWHGHDETVMRRTYTHTTVDDLRALIKPAVGAL